MTEIRPHIDAQGEPTCSGEECPKVNVCWPKGVIFNREEWCAPGLRRLLAEAREERDAAYEAGNTARIETVRVELERDAARREVCAIVDPYDSPPYGARGAYATSRGWSCLYAPTQGGGVKGGGE